jgi:hypothetical protein
MVGENLSTRKERPPHYHSAYLIHHKITINKVASKHPVEREGSGRKRSETLGRSTQKSEGNTGMYLGGIGWEGVDWIYLAQDRNL